VFFGLFYHNSFFNILRKNILITCCCCFAAVAIGADGWVLSVERCQTNSVVPKFMAIPFSGGDLKKILSKEQNK
jgi:hypothetical protein